MKRGTDVLINGGEPAGLAVAIAARKKGLDVTVAEGAKPPIDKAYGEGLMLRSLVALVVLAALCALPQHAAPRTVESQLVLSLNPAQSNVHWTLGSSLHTVHGTFAFKQGSLEIDPVNDKVIGEIVVDATSGNSGNDSRDKKMHKDVLQSSRFSEVVFRPDSFTGKLASQGESAVEVHGTFVLHGSEHELTVPVKVKLDADHWAGNAAFSVPFIDWGLKNPSNWLLKVEHVVKVDLEMKGNLQSLPGR